MYPVAVRGGGVTARAVLIACRRTGFERLAWTERDAHTSLQPAWTLSANLTRVVHALGRGDALAEMAYAPNREQVRLARSGFLVAELPLGKFAADRYGAPHLNIEEEDLLEVLAPGGELAAAEPPVVVVDTRTQPTEQEASHTLWHAQLAQPQPQHANITWLGSDQHAWQLSTLRATHFYLSAPAGRDLDPADWHPDLHDAVSEAHPLREFTASDQTVREHWYEGNIAYAGDACFTGHPYRREATQLGLEDAWVLSRMLENYEEDFADGLAEYEKFRRARVRRVANKNLHTAALYDRAGELGRTLRNLNIALASRFLPEIAMQRIDWLYSYDCIRGFR